MTYISTGSVTGFDVTNINGTVQIASDYQISTNSSTTGTTQNWTITITFINLTTNQEDNTGKTFDAKLILQKDVMTTTDTTLAKLSINKTNIDLTEPNFQMPADNNYYCVISDNGTTQKVFDMDNGSLTSTTGTENTCAVNIYRYDGTNAIQTGMIVYFNQATYTDTDSNTTYTGTLVGTGSWQKEATGIYSKADDYGTSYYYRGAVNNNWLKFGKYETDWYSGQDSNSNGMQGTSCTGITTDCTKVASAGDDMYWRIVRINGDGSIKLIYAGVTAPTSATSIVNDNNTLGPSRYNTSYNSAEYVGYMYTLGELHGTGTSSTIKTYLENWYSNNLSNYDSKIADSIYCNDRTVYQLNTTIWGDGTSGTGIGTNITFFGAFNRLVPSGYWGGTINGTPILTCPTKTDAFTKSDTTKGNGKLSQKIGLLTADETNLGGLGVELTSYSNYLGSNNSFYWLESPFEFIAGCARVFKAGENGYISYEEVPSSSDSSHVRPSISLSSNIQITGSGTWDDPYIAK